MEKIIKKSKIQKEERSKTQRPPVVVILGHIDHGKSSLLEAIRDFKITAKESGGITQHIGAYQIEEDGKKITFLDTPGHEAFSQMRSRGASVADIAILVIDSSESVKPQTKEALLTVKKLNVPMIIALNKVDKPGADPEKVKRDLTKEDVLVESMGGKVPTLEVSAKTGKGIKELLDLILLVAEMEELEADIEKPAQGVVIESRMDNFRGPTATLLLKQGTLRVGDVIATTTAYLKIKSLEDFKKTAFSEAYPSDPIIVFGFNQAPKIGDEFRVFSDLESAQQSMQITERQISPLAEVSDDQRALNLILKADVGGSLEAIEDILKNLPQDRIVLRILKSEAGIINESDVKQAKSGNALILGFRVKTDATSKSLAEREKVRIMNYEIIYDLVEGVRKIMERMLAPEDVRQDVGRVKVLQIFLTEKNRQIIGGKVADGQVKKGSLIEIIRRDEKVGRGKIISLQRNKKEAEFVLKGDECGLLFEGSTRVSEGDILQFYTESKVKTSL